MECLRATWQAHLHRSNYCCGGRLPLLHPGVFACFGFCFSLPCRGLALACALFACTAAQQARGLTGWCTASLPQRRLLPLPAQVIGLVGALGLTPLCLVLPPVLYPMARRSQLAAWKRWALYALAALFGGVGVLAAVGALRGIVVAIEQHTFFS